MQSVIQVDKLHYTIQNHNILNNLTFEIKEGELVLITGENGSGKTTLIKLLLGLEKPTSGTIKLFNREIESFANWKNIGYLPQNLYQVLDDLPITVDEFMYSGFSSNRGYRSKRSELDDIFKFDQYSTRLLSSLSGGQAQRVFLARSLIDSPQILILDEPTAGIDSASKVNLVNFIKKLHESKISIIIITHETGMFESMSDRVLCVNQNSFMNNPKLEHVHK